MLKEYKEKNGYGIHNVLCRNKNKDKYLYYAINGLTNGLYYNWCGLNKIFWCKGFTNMDERNGHWLDYDWGDFKKYFLYHL